MSDQQNQRLDTLHWIREQGIDAYPARCKRSHTAQEAIAAFAALEAEAAEGEQPDLTVYRR